jgi:hypothetical protein
MDATGLVGPGKKAFYNSYSLLLEKFLWQRRNFFKEGNWSRKDRRELG